MTNKTKIMTHDHSFDGDAASHDRDRAAELAHDPNTLSLEPTLDEQKYAVESVHAPEDHEAAVLAWAQLPRKTRRDVWKQYNRSIPREKRIPWSGNVVPALLQYLRAKRPGLQTVDLEAIALGLNHAQRRVLKAQGKLAAALDEYHDALAIRPLQFENLTQQDAIVLGLKGCGPGSGWMEKIVPEFKFHADCVRHDFEYWKSGTRLARLRADWRFLVDMLRDLPLVRQEAGRLVRSGTIGKNLVLALVYFAVVRALGWTVFPRSKFRRTWRDLLNVYKTKGERRVPCPQTDYL